VETNFHLHRLVHCIRDRQVSPGVSLNPATPVSSLEEILGDVDLVLVMSVNPGFGGQHFIPATLDKIRRIKEMIRQKPQPILLEVDGGINAANAAAVAAAGADVLVAGSAVYGSANISQAIQTLKNSG
jgi:ribulose-phosphate 3-epimerase